MANANGSIDEIIGQQAYQQVDQMKAKLAELEQSFIATAKAASSLMSTNVGGGTGNGGIKATTQSLTELEKATQRLIKANNEYGSDLAKIKVLLAQQTAANKNEAKESLAAAGSYNKMQSEMTILLAKYKALSAEMRSGSVGKAMAADIAKLNSELKALDSSLGNNQRNVGNYAGALSKVWAGLRQIAYILPGLGIAGIFNLIGEGIGKLFPQIGELYDKIVNGNQEAQKAAKELSEDIGKQTGKFESLTRQLNDNNLSRKEHIKAAKELKELYPTALKNYSLEEIAAGKAAGAINLIKDALIAVAMARAAQADIDKAAGEKYANEKRIEELKAKLILEKENQKVLLEQTKTINKNDNYYNLVVERANMSTKAISSMSSEIDNLTNKNLVLENSMNKTAAAIGNYNASANAGGLNLEGEDLSKGKKKDKGKTRIELLQQQYDEEVKTTRKKYSELYKTEEEWQIKLLEINDKYAKMRIDKMTKEEQSQRIDFDDKILKSTQDVIEKQTKALNQQIKNDIDNNKRSLRSRIKDNEERLKDEQKSCDEIDRIGEEAWKKQQERQKKTKATDEEIAAAKIKLEQDIANSIASISESIINAIYSRKLQEFDAIDKKLTETYNNELRFIEQSGLSAKQKERQKQELEAETEAKRKKNDKDRVDALRKQAKLQKALDINSLISSTAIAVMAALGAKPYTPANILLAAGAAVTGAAQLAKVIATPLPQYAKGRKGGKAEWAIVGEKGIEGIRTPDGKMSLTPDKPTVTFLPKDAEVIPHHEMIKNAAFVNLAKQSQVTVDKYQEALIAKFEEELEELRGIKSAILNKEFGNAVNVYKGFEQYKNSNIR